MACKYFSIRLLKERNSRRFSQKCFFQNTIKKRSCENRLSPFDSKFPKQTVHCEADPSECIISTINKSLNKCAFSNLQSRLLRN
jgi:hypothetical protein